MPNQAAYTIVSYPDPTPMQEKGLVYFERFLGLAGCKMSCDFNYWHGNALSGMQQCGLICAAGALSHEKSHAVNLIGAPEIRTATSSSPRNRSKYTRPSSPCRGGVWDRNYLYHRARKSRSFIDTRVTNRANPRTKSKSLACSYFEITATRRDS